MIKFSFFFFYLRAQNCRSSDSILSSFMWLLLVGEVYKKRHILVVGK